jgi:chromosome segregation ATPase
MVGACVQALALRGQKLMQEQTKASLKLLQARQDLEVFNESADERKRELAEARDAAEEATNRKDQARVYAMEVRDKFNERMAAPAEDGEEDGNLTDVLDEWRRAVDAEGGPSIDELEEEKERCVARLRLTGQTNERLVRQYETRKTKVSVGFRFAWPF